jgi:succinate-acetate transporter protein
MLMFINAKWVEAATVNAMMMYACFYGGFGQMVAGVFEVIITSKSLHHMSFIRRLNPA